MVYVFTWNSQNCRGAGPILFSDLLHQDPSVLIFTMLKYVLHGNRKIELVPPSPRAYHGRCGLHPLQGGLFLFLILVPMHREMAQRVGSFNVQSDRS